MFGNFTSRNSILFHSQSLLYEVLSIIRNVWPMNIHKRIAATFSHIFYLLKKIRLKWQFSRKHEVKYDPETENIDFFVIILLLVYLWCDETRSSRIFLSGRQLIYLVFIYCKAEVDKLDLFHAFFLVVHYNLYKKWDTSTFSGLRSLWMIPSSLLT